MGTVHRQLFVDERVEDSIDEDKDSEDTDNVDDSDHNSSSELSAHEEEETSEDESITLIYTGKDRVTIWNAQPLTQNVKTRSQNIIRTRLP